MLFHINDMQKLRLNTLMTFYGSQALDSKPKTMTCSYREFSFTVVTCCCHMNPLTSATCSFSSSCIPSKLIFAQWSHCKANRWKTVWGNCFYLDVMESSQLLEEKNGQLICVIEDEDICIWHNSPTRLTSVNRFWLPSVGIKHLYMPLSATITLLILRDMSPRLRPSFKSDVLLM